MRIIRSESDLDELPDFTVVKEYLEDARQMRDWSQVYEHISSGWFAAGNDFADHPVLPVIVIWSPDE